MQESKNTTTLSLLENIIFIALKECVLFFLNKILIIITYTLNLSCRTKIAETASSWLDDYFSWIDPNGENSCCRMLYTHDQNGTMPVFPPTFCNATGK